MDDRGFDEWRREFAITHHSSSMRHAPSLSLAAEAPVGVDASGHVWASARRGPLKPPAAVKAYEIIMWRFVVLAIGILAAGGAGVHAWSVFGWGGEPDVAHVDAARDLQLMADDAEIDRGKALLERYALVAEPSCWSDAVNRVESACATMTDGQQAWLAFALLNCHLRKSGRSTYPCSETLPLEVCTGSLSEHSFQLYTIVFNEARAICAFVLARDFKSETSRMLVALHAAATESAGKLLDMEGRMRGLAEGQERLAELTAASAAEVVALGAAVDRAGAAAHQAQVAAEGARAEAEAVVGTLTHAAGELRVRQEEAAATLAQLSQQGDRHARVLGAILGHAHNAADAAFYATAAAAVLAATMAVPLAAVRGPAMALLAGCYLSERYLLERCGGWLAIAPDGSSLGIPIPSLVTWALRATVGRSVPAVDVKWSVRGVAMAFAVALFRAAARAAHGWDGPGGAPTSVAERLGMLEKELRRTRGEVRRLNDLMSPLASPRGSPWPSGQQAGAGRGRAEALPGEARRHVALEMDGQASSSSSEDASEGFGSSEAGEGPEVSLAHLAAPDGHRRTRGEGQQLGTPASTRSGAVRGTPKSGKSSGGRADGAHERLTSPRARRTPRGGRGRGKAGGAPETDGGDTTRHTSPLQGRA